ncbi:hypothetical protein [Nocardia carnea]|nr:hypothetical protein [Nocardia carnea]
MAAPDPNMPRTRPIGMAELCWELVRAARELRARPVVAILG